MFGKIYYINLKHRTDRHDNVINQLGKINKLHLAERIDAVNGKHIDIANLSPELITAQGKKDALDSTQKLYTHLTEGAIGCALSHKKTYEKIVNDNVHAALILEDDITIDDRFNEMLLDISNNIPLDYDILFLGYHNDSIKDFDRPINQYYTIPRKLYGLFGYIVTNNGARKLLDIFPITYQIDSEIPLHFDKMTVYAVNPEYRIIKSDPSSTSTLFGTDIQVRTQTNNNNLLIFFLILLLLVILLIFSL